MKKKLFALIILTFTLIACAEMPISNRSNDFRGCGSGPTKTTEVVTTVGWTPSPTLTASPTWTPLPTWTPSPTATPIPPLPAELLAQGYTLAEAPPVLQWGDVTYEVELYAPPFGAKRMLRHLFVFKRQNGQSELLERVASLTLTLDLPFQAIGAQWPSVYETMPFLMGKVAYHPEDPNLFYCRENCDQPGQELLGSFWLDHRNGEFNHNPAHMKFYGWAGISWQGAQYEAVSVMIGGYSNTYVYKKQDGQISSLLDVADLSGLIDIRDRIILDKYIIINNIEIKGWNDINADGLPEILFWAGHGGSGPCHPLIMVQIQLDGSLSQIPVPECTIAVHDLDHDGDAEFITTQGSYSAILPACGGAAPCNILEIYVWDGTRYVEANHAEFTDYYLEALFGVVDDVSFSDLYRLEEIIYVYRLIERPEEGLHVFDAYTNPTCYDEDARADLLRLRDAYDLPLDLHRACAIVRPSE